MTGMDGKSIEKNQPNQLNISCGAIFSSSNQVQFRVWAPKCSSLFVSILHSNRPPTRLPMVDSGYGIFKLDFFSEERVIDYFYEPEEGVFRPDPHSRWQPFGVHGPSRLYDTHVFEWGDGGWKGIPLSEYIIYEMHIGTFTPEGTFEGAIGKLEFLSRLGVTAIELMPITEFPGDRNWGYDGVYPYAPHHAYGGPDGLKSFIDACHRMNLAVILDVVYNHLGPEGNYSELYGYYFTNHYRTPWGSAVNFDGPYSDFVRKYFIDNTLYWLEEYHVDALRLDATHAIFDSSPVHILEEIQEAFRLKAEQLGREAFIFVESDLNDVKLLRPRERGGYSLDAQWSDDFHHSLQEYLTKSTSKYLQDFGRIGQIGKAIKEGFVYDGRWSSFRKKIFGTSSTDIPGEHFVICLENHDQVGNGGKGERLGPMIGEKKFRLASALLFCTPSIPLIFMGQEWNAQNDFLYFTSFEDKELASLVSEGYRNEFCLGDEEIFSPQDLIRFERSKIQWSELESSSHQAMLEFYKTLIGLRRKLPFLRTLRKDLCQVQTNEEEKWMVITRRSPCGSMGIIAANFNDVDQQIPAPLPPGKWELILSTAESSLGGVDVERSRKMIEVDSSNGAGTSIDVPGWTVVIYEKR